MGIAVYLGDKILDQLIDYIKNSDNNIELMHEKLDYIDEKLDRLITAPYRAAIVYYEEGDLAKFKEKIIDTFTKDPYNLPARLTYVSITINEGNYDVAIKNYWRILDDFGYIRGMMPEHIMNTHFQQSLACIESSKIIFYPNRKGINDYEDRRFVAKEIWISKSLVCIKWKKLQSGFFSLSSYELSLFNLDKGCEIYRKKSYSDITIINLTNNYLYLLIDNNKCQVDKNGRTISGTAVDYSIFQNLFLFNKQSISSENKKFSLGCLNFSIEQVEKYYEYRIWGDGTGFHEGRKPYNLSIINMEKR